MDYGVGVSVGMGVTTGVIVTGGIGVWATVGTRAGAQSGTSVAVPRGCESGVGIAAGAIGGGAGLVCPIARKSLMASRFS